MRGSVPSARSVMLRVRAGLVYPVTAPPIEDGAVLVGDDGTIVMVGPHHVLFEGNYGFNFDSDKTHGNSIYHTVFRNHLTGKRRSIAPLQLTDALNPRAIGLAEGHKWYSFVGNVLGTADQNPYPSTRYVYDALFPWTDDPIGMWRLGYNPEDWAAPPDPNRTSAFLNVRVADIQKAYEEWSAKGAEFLTEPKDHGREIRAYIRDPDGHLIEVGQSVM